MKTQEKPRLMKVEFGAEGEKMTEAQKYLFTQVVTEAWQTEQKKVMVHLDNLVFMAQVAAVQKGLM